MCSGLWSGVRTETHALGGGLAVEPEGDHRERHEQHARDVDLDDEVARVPLQVEAHADRRELACACVARAGTLRLP